MRIAMTIAEVRTWRRALRKDGRTIGLVPTMGALHEGHLSLVRAARSQCDAVAVSIFVNPTQFGPAEDLDRYPRPFEDDCRLLEAEGVELLFAPLAEEMYPSGATTFVLVEGVSERLDGASRPGHFRGVATVVAKLFNIVAPDKVFFGQKDAAQVAVLKKMVCDLNFNLAMVVCPTMREPDGLAMSSRNRYLSPEERSQALALYRALQRVEQRVSAGEVKSAELVAAVREILAEEPAVRVDYIAAVDPKTLKDVTDVSGGALIAVAAFVGTTRLIDNLVVTPAPK